MKVYISGLGVVSSLGNTPDHMFGSLLESRSAVRMMNEWESVGGLHSKLGAPAIPYDKSVIPRMARRTMSAMAEMSTLAAQQALQQAGLQAAELNFPRSLLLMGSTTGSPICLEEYFRKLVTNNGVGGQSGTSFFKVMNHSIPSNVAVALGFSGAVLSPSSACSTSAQAAILGWELLQSGLYDLAIVGGSDELHYLSATVFDSVYAASRGYHDSPTASPRPFDKNRDGLVVSEGAGVVVLETEAHLQKRGGKPIGEFCGGAYMCESSHMSQNNENQMGKVMNMALERARVTKDQIEYVNAHATGTVQGDAQEAQAVGKLFGTTVPVSSLKAHFGHSMAACGMIELISILKMMEAGTLIGTRNLDEIAPDCEGPLHLRENIKRNIDVALSNNFAFGGINTTLVVKKYS